MEVNHQSRQVTRSVIRSIESAFLACASIATIASLFAREFWVADLLANLRIQQLIAITVSLLVFLLFRRKVAVLWAVVLIGIHLPAMQPSLGEASALPTTIAPLRITLANVLTSNQRHTDVISDLTARDPDVIAVLEIGTTLARKLNETLSTQYPYSSVYPQDDVTPTWYRWPSFPFGLVLDHCLISKNVKCVSHEVGPDTGSDHRSVTVELAPNQ